MAVAVAVALAGIAFKQLFDEPGGLELVELPDALAEAVLGQFIDLGFIEPVVVHDLDDEILLLGRAVPLFVVAVGGLTVAVAVARVAGGVAVRVAIAVGRFGLGQPADLLNARINAVLKQTIQASGLGRNLVDVGDLSFQREAELMAAVAGQTDFLAVVGFDDESHRGCLSDDESTTPVHPSGQGEGTGECFRGWRESSRPVKGRPMWLSKHYTARSRRAPRREGAAEQERLDGQRIVLNPPHENDRTPQPRPLPVMPAHLKAGVRDVFP